MKFSRNWLREFIDIQDIDSQKIGDSLTLHTCELEEIIEVSQNFDHVFAGKLLEVKSHENSDKLHVGIFDCGKKGKKQIVFGNVFDLTVGEMYPVALDGAKLASGVEIANTEVRGVKSEGMVCTCSELGMKQETLLRFNESDTGKSLPEIIPEFGDILFDIDNKSLTHRPDLMGHRGMARELGAIFSRSFQADLDSKNLEIDENLKPFLLKIETEKCRRFCAIKLENVTVEPSEIATQARLENVGIRAISNLVDLTNLSLAGLGQPMHVFDADKIKGGITIRLAKKGEKLLALDEEEYELTTEDIVVADDEKVLSIAGIMGGLESSVTKDTKNIVFESANFDATSIRHTSARLGLRSESSMRYEKSLDPEQCKDAIIEATQKTLKLCSNAKITTGIADVYPNEPEEILIDLNPEQVRKLSGIEISNEEIIGSLESLGFEVWTEEGTTNLVVKVPSWRATKDVAIAEDLVEEVVRLRGFDAVPSKLPSLPVKPPRRNKLREMEWKIRDLLMSEGRNEVYLTSFVGPKDPEWIDSNEHITIQNGANEEYEKLRRTLVSNAVRGMESELRTQGKLNLFEIGTIFPAMGKEKRNLLLFSAKMNGDSVQSFFEQKSELLRIFHALGVNAEIKSCANPEKMDHPVQCADVFIDDTFIGKIAVLHPTKNPVRGASVVYTELNLQLLLPFVCDVEIRYQKSSTFPIVRRDLSLVMKKEVNQADLVSEMTKVSDILVSVDLFDVFIDKNKLGSENKNLAFHLAFQSQEKTLDEIDVDTAVSRVEEVLKKKFNAELRLAFDQKKS